LAPAALLWETFLHSKSELVLLTHVPMLLCTSHIGRHHAELPMPNI
jgi:hypothetical protein